MTLTAHWNNIAPILALIAFMVMIVLGGIATNRACELTCWHQSPILYVVRDSPAGFVFVAAPMGIVVGQAVAARAQPIGNATMLTLVVLLSLSFVGQFARITLGISLLRHFTRISLAVCLRESIMTSFAMCVQSIGSALVFVKLAHRLYSVARRTRFGIHNRSYHFISSIA